MNSIKTAEVTDTTGNPWTMTIIPGTVYTTITMKTVMNTVVTAIPTITQKDTIVVQNSGMTEEISMMKADIITMNITTTMS